MALTNEDLQAIEQLLEPIRQEIRSIQLTLENETNRNIKLIAEGHLDFNRKLDAAISSTLPSVSHTAAAFLPSQNALP